MNDIPKQMNRRRENAGWVLPSDTLFSVYMCKHLIVSESKKFYRVLEVLQAVPCPRRSLGSVNSTSANWVSFRYLQKQAARSAAD